MSFINNKASGRHCESKEDVLRVTGHTDISLLCVGIFMKLIRPSSVHPKDIGRLISWHSVW